MANTLKHGDQTQMSKQDNQASRLAGGPDAANPSDASKTAEADTGEADKGLSSIGIVPGNGVSSGTANVTGSY